MSSAMALTRRQQLKLLGVWACASSLPLATGCGDAQAEAYDEVRRRVLLKELPNDVSSLAATHLAFEEGKQVRVVGRIFSALGSPFHPDVASFNLIELPKPGHNHDDPGDCPFCKRDMENATTAVVQIVDEAGNVLKPSADKLLGLSKNQDIVVDGTATKVGDIMMVSAKAIHILSPENSLDFAKRIHAAPNVARRSASADIHSLSTSKRIFG
jgi:hypothetical protein